MQFYGPSVIPGFQILCATFFSIDILHWHFEIVNVLLSIF